MTSAACEHCGLPVPRARRATPYCCYGCKLARELTRQAQNDGDTPHAGTLALRLGLGAFLTVNLMVFNGLFYAQHIFGPTQDPAYTHLAQLAAYLLLLLGTIVVAALGVPLAADSVFALIRTRRLDVNLLIVLGVAAAFGLSVVNTLRGEHAHLYYDTAAVILVLVTLGKYLDARARAAATRTTGDLLAALRGRAYVRRSDAVAEVDIDALCIGDIVRVRAGEAAPVDGVIVEGRAHLREADLTGESHPRAVAPGDTVLAGAVSVDGLLWLRAAAVGEQRVIATMQRMLDQARMRQPRIAQLADRVAAVFIPGVLLLAAAVFAFNAWRGLPVTGLLNALSVLLVSCPCALGLAAPLATWTALGRAAAGGVIVDSGRTLERAAHVTDLFIDKTGTLTERDMTLTAVICEDNMTRADAIARAAALETASTHPLADVFTQAAGASRLAVPRADAVRTTPGLGLSGAVAGHTLHLGSSTFVHTRLGVQPPTADDDTAMHVYLFDDRAVLARFKIAESLRPDAAEAIARLRRRGLSVTMLTGDRAGPASRIAAMLGIEAHAGLLPADKVAHLEHHRRANPRAVLAMVGDGINDAPVLAAADIAITVGSASDLARRAGDIHLADDRLTNIPHVLALARHAMRRIRLNLVWALAYHIVGIALATVGLLNPVLAAAAMLASSLMIVVTSRNAGRISTHPSHPIAAAAQPAGGALEAA